MDKTLIVGNMNMKTGRIALFMICWIFCGCIGQSFDVSKIGEMHFGYTTWSNGKTSQYECRVQADQLKSVLKAMAPRDPQYDIVFTTGSRTASLQYEGKEIEFEWARVKMADIVVLIYVQGQHFMLKQPEAGQFIDLLEQNTKESSQPEH